MIGQPPRFARWKLEEIQPFYGPNIGHVRQFIATGKRGASYGCLVYETGRWCWTNLHRASQSVPFDLNQINPALYFQEAPCHP
uniref:Uncharacterized protein n=1 Tax=viral metagenome TaxID=1070528 RepID=A0A6H2A2R4_9ZZZZ